MQSKDRHNLDSRHGSASPYRVIFDKSLDGIIIISAEQGIIKTLNPAALNILGYASESTLAGEHYRVLFPKNREKELETLNEWHGYGAVIPNRRFCRGDGTTCRVDITTSMISWEDEEAFLITVRDADERLRMEQSVRESERKYRSLFESSSEAIAALDSAFNIIDINPGYARLLQYSCDELREMGWKAIIGDDEKRKSYLQNLELTGQSESELNLARMDGTYVTVEQLVQKIHFQKQPGYLVVSRDISQKKQAELARRESELIVQRAHQRLEHVLANSLAVLYTVETPQNGRLSYITPNVEDVFGYSSDYFLTDPMFLLDRIHPSDTDMVKRAWNESWEKGESIVEYRFLKSSLTYCWVREVRKVSSSSDGQHREVVGYWVDITDTKKAQRELELSKEQAEAANQAKSQFLAIMSHEFRTPLNAILGCCELIGYKPLDPQQKKYLYHVADNGNRLLELVTDVLDYATLDSARTIKPHPVPVDISKELFKLLDHYNDQANLKGLDLSIVIADNFPQTVLCDIRRLRQVFNHLMTNALKFTKEGRVQFHAAARKNESSDTWQLSFKVEDTGIGIREEDIPVIFEPFQQADTTDSRAYGGTGLGLAICKRVVTSLGGTIDCESEPGRGTIFTFNIHCKSPPQGTPTIFGGFFQAPQNSHPQILVVDHDSRRSEYLGSALKSLGQEFEIASTPNDIKPKLVADIFTGIFMCINEGDPSACASFERIIKELRSKDPKTSSHNIHLVGLFNDPESEYAQHLTGLGLDDAISLEFDREIIQEALKQFPVRKRPKPE